MIEYSSKFTFKKVELYQQNSVFKIGTDAVLLASWLYKNNYNSILEIGSGTGVISLLLSQNNENSKFIAIDSSIDAVALTEHNFKLNTLTNFNVIHNSFEAFFEKNIDSFDLIVSNPPFFINDLKAESVVNVQAKHAVSFDFDLFFEKSASSLTQDGELAMIFPFQSKEYLTKYAEKNGLYIKSMCDIYPKENKEANRFIVIFSKDKKVSKITKLIIYNEDKSYTTDYKQLTKEFYLKF
jgi:tRNA1Val (adenine37-N6)-methyltransferase